MVRGEGDDIWYQRLWRQLEPDTLEAIVAQSQRFCYRYFALISHDDCIEIAQFDGFLYDALSVTD